MKLTCPSCNREIASEDISLSSMLAKCPPCGEVFSFADRIPGAKPQPNVPVVRPKFDPPDGVVVSKEGKELTIESKWFTWAVIPLAFFAVLWNTFMVFWMGTALSSGLWPMAAFGSIHTAVGIGLIYGVFTLLLNVTYLEVKDGRLKITHEPLPFPGNQDLDISQLEQLYTQRKISRTKNGTNVTYEVHAVTSDRRHIKLIGGLSEARHALFLEQEIEDFVGIVDAPVAGEFSREERGVHSFPAPAASTQPILGISAKSSSAGSSVGDERASASDLSVTNVERSAHPDCPVCGDPTKVNVKLCPDCDTPHHEECWKYQDGCSMYGCQGK